MRMWSAIRRGAGVGPVAIGGSAANLTLSCARAGEGSIRRARSTSDLRTRHVRPARTAARRPVLIHDRTVA